MIEGARSIDGKREGREFHSCRNNVEDIGRHG
jgi:hypothetical protein